MRRIEALRTVSIALVALGIVTIGASAFVDGPHPPEIATAARSDASTPPVASIVPRVVAPRVVPHVPQPLVRRTARPRALPHVARRASPAPRLVLHPSPRPRVARVPSPRPRVARVPSPRPRVAASTRPRRTPAPKRVARALPPPRVAGTRPPARVRAPAFDAGYRQAAERDYVGRAAENVAASGGSYDSSRTSLAVEPLGNGVVRVIVWDRKAAAATETFTMKRTANGFAVLSRVPVTPAPVATPGPTPSPTPAPRRRRRFL